MVSWDQFKYIKEGNQYRDTRKEKIKERVREIIRNNDSSGGIHEKQLAKEIDKNPKNLRKYLNELVSEGLIIKKNKLAPYFSTDKSYQDPLLKANLFGEKFSNRIRKYAQKELIILTNKKQTNNDGTKICTIPYYSSNCNNSSHSIDHDFCILFERYKFFYQPKFTENHKLETFLFEFSNMVGGFISYLLIKTLRDNNNIKNSNKNSIQKKDYKLILDILSNIIPTLFQIFKEDIFKIEGNNPTVREFNEMNKEKASTLKNLSLKKIKTKDDEKIIKEITNNYYKYKIDYLKNRSSTLNYKEMSYKLEKSFFNIYPLLFHELRKIDVNLDSELSRYKEFINNIQKKSELQKKCKHEYGYPTLDQSGNYIRACKNKINLKKDGDEVCGFRKRIDESIGESFIKMDELLNSNEDNSYVLTNISDNRKGKKSIKVKIRNDKGEEKNFIFIREGIKICNEYIEQLPDNKKAIR